MSDHTFIMSYNLIHNEGPLDINLTQLSHQLGAMLQCGELDKLPEETQEVFRCMRMFLIGAAVQVRELELMSIGKSRREIEHEAAKEKTGVWWKWVREVS